MKDEYALRALVAVPRLLIPFYQLAASDIEPKMMVLHGHARTVEL
jgi:hypothetical protein